ncbi:hypothetical protein ZIOFF_028803 [Zingiber officinale]|uniref:mannose-6-phosphate isomerase n=1 Tax=Zingiber officinale TaxID=94328 RepID=A0A8J5GLS8_ZINOF|nr:hypothetical protein ZIOFF_028803 [Zingiber officinale]
MGTHELGPSFGGSDSEEVTLKKWIRENPGALGDKVVVKWGTNLPFLFKILLVTVALSIQAHPEKELARMLHMMQPNVYKDPNHKPEMAIALIEFKALYGFVNIEELKDILIGVAEITELVSNDATSKIICMRELNVYVNVKAIVQSVFTKLMSANKDGILALVSKQKNRLEAENKIRRLSEREQLALLMEKQYHADVGVLAAFFLNYVKLNPGEALYIGPNEPHAYISGECIKCMAASDMLCERDWHLST